MPVSFIERCNSVRCKGVWRGATAGSTLRDDLTFIESVSLRNYDILF